MGMLNRGEIEGWDSGGPAAAAAAKSLQSCPTLCNPIDGSPPGSTIPGIYHLQKRILLLLRPGIDPEDDDAQDTCDEEQDDG